MTPDDWGRVGTALRRYAGITVPATMRRMVELAFDDLGVTRTPPVDDRAAWDRVLDRLFIGTSWFARERAGIDALVGALAQRAATRPDRVPTVWSAGCATGEEPYSIAMALADAGCTAHVVGTDFHRPSLAIASTGRYSAATYRSAPASWQQRYFEAKPGADGRYQVIAAIRARVRFVRHNLAVDEIVGRDFDAVVCRNVLIYFEHGDAVAALARLVTACGPEGHLLLGALEAPLLWMCTSDSRLGAASVPLLQVPTTSPLRVPPSDLARIASGAAQRAGATRETVRARETASAHAREGRLERALHTLDKTSVTAPLDAATHLARGLLLKRLGKTHAAIDAFRGARFLDNGAWLAPYQLAVCLDSVGDHAEAREAYRHALEVIPSGRSGLSPPDESVDVMAATVAATCRAKLAAV